AAGSVSLLLEVHKELYTHNLSHFYAQEKNVVTYNLLRMNLLMHGIPYRSFTTYNDDTLAHDNFKNISEGFQLQVANPPYSLKFDFSKSFENDPRFASCALPPKSYADLGFVEHMVYHMSNDGRIAVLLPHGVLFRGNNEKKIREYLIGTLNVVDAIIGLPANMFHGATIPTLVMILKKDRNGDSDNIFFIDASKEFKKGKTMNELRDEDIKRIVETYKNRENVDKYAYKAPLSEVTENNDYNLNIPRYVDTFEEETPIDLNDVRSKIKYAKEQKQATLDTVNQMLRELGLEEM
ncbi:MAG: N-6 DNA methylase, partial [Streptococcus sp.]